MKQFRLEASGVTDVGAQKLVNEDSFVYKILEANGEHTGVFAVADGVGSLAMGEVASSVAISYINRWWDGELKNSYGDPELVVSTLLDALKKANLDLLRRAQGRPTKLATTLSVLVLMEGSAIIAHIGDSRVYRIRGGLMPGITQLTEDHTCLIQTEFGGQRVQKSVLTQCLGNKEDYRHFCSVTETKKRDIFLICSDGVYKTLSSGEILREARQYRGDLRSFCRALVERAKEKGETDNITAVAVQVCGDAGAQGKEV